MLLYIAELLAATHYTENTFFYSFKANEPDITRPQLNMCLAFNCGKMNT